MPEGLEGRIEAMAEDLVVRMARLQKQLNALHLSATSGKEKAKIQKWADIENGELINLKKSIWEQKRSHLNGLSADDRIRLANRHPVWMVCYDIYLDQIREPFLVYKDKMAIVRCTLMPQQSKALQIYRFGGGGTILCINLDRSLRYEAVEGNRESVTPVGDLPQKGGKFIFRTYD